MTKGFVFDFDGVLTQAEKFSVKYQKKFGISEKEMQLFFRGGFQDILIGKKDLKEEIAPYLKKWKWTGTLEDFLIYWFESDSLDERVIDVIESVKKSGAKCFLATNQEKYRMEYVRNEMGMGSLMDEIFFSAEMGVKKSEKKFFQKMIQSILENFSIESGNLIFWDNSLFNVEKAREVDIKSHVYKDFDDFKKIMNKYLN